MTRSEQTTQDPRWAAVVARDAARDGEFFYSVKTTGVYCRPSCAARRALPENVQFHPSTAAAEAAGFRPCKRCRPDSATAPHAATIERICRTIAAADEMLTLKDLAAEAGLSEYHFHRVFKATTGVTPRAYAAARREERLRAALGNGEPVTSAIYDAGYNSNSRFYSGADDVLGMKPSAYRGGGKNQEIRFAVGECSLGSILVAASDRGVCAILLGDDPDELAQSLQDQFPRATIVGGDASFEAIVASAVGLVDSPGTAADLPLDIQGTAFQRRVWQALRDIPSGSTASYSDVARRIGSPASVRAVARACASNRIAVAIPCHRVVRNDGALSGYRWGVERKRALLDREAGA